MSSPHTTVLLHSTRIHNHSDVANCRRFLNYFSFVHGERTSRSMAMTHAPSAQSPSGAHRKARVYVCMYVCIYVCM